MTMPQGYYELAWLAAEERAGRPTEGERERFLMLREEVYS